MTHSASAVLVGHQHADKDEEHEDGLQRQHAGPQQPGLLHPAGGGVPAAPAARPARQTDGHVRVAHASVAPVHGAAICTRSYAHTQTHAHVTYTSHGTETAKAASGDAPDVFHWTQLENASPGSSEAGGEVCVEDMRHQQVEGRGSEAQTAGQMLPTYWSLQA